MFAAPLAQRDDWELVGTLASNLWRIPSAKSVYRKAVCAGELLKVSAVLAGVTFHHFPLCSGRQCLLGWFGQVIVCRPTIGDVQQRCFSRGGSPFSALAFSMFCFIRCIRFMGMFLDVHGGQNHTVNPHHVFVPVPGDSPAWDSHVG